VICWLLLCTIEDIPTATSAFASVLVGIIATFGAAAHADPKREVPDYDGRGNQDADAGSWALWIPRIVLSPLYVANEYVLRRPIGAVVRHAERERWADSVVQLFTFGEGGKSLIVPTALYDFGLLPSVGFYYSGDDIVTDGNQLRLHAATWARRGSTRRPPTATRSTRPTGCRSGSNSGGPRTT